MPKYSVRVCFKGENVYIVEALDEEEAESMACEECEFDVEGLDSCEPDTPKLVKTNDS